LMTTKGYAAPDVEHTFARARALCQVMGDTPQRFPVLSGLFAFYLVKGDLVTAHDLAEQCLQLAETVQDSAFLIESHRMLSNVFHFTGDPAAAVRHADCALALYDPHQHRTLAFMFGQDPAVVCHIFAAANLRVLGYPVQALQRNQEALIYARELEHANSLGLALAFASTLQGFLKNWTETLILAEEAMMLANEQGLVFWGTVGASNRGWALIGLGQYEEGLAFMQKGLAAYWATGAELARVGNLSVLAEGYGHAGRIAEGLQMIAEALSLADKNEGHAWKSELYRIKGDLLLQQSQASIGQVSSQSQAGQEQPEDTDPQVAAEACFLKAIELAQHQQAKMNELRATVGLARLWQLQGKHHAAHNMLSSIYNWFTEGFDTADLQEAKVMLEKLSH